MSATGRSSGGKRTSSTHWLLLHFDPHRSDQPSRIWFLCFKTSPQDTRRAILSLSAPNGFGCDGLVDGEKTGSRTWAAIYLLDSCGLPDNHLLDLASQFQRIRHHKMPARLNTVLKYRESPAAKPLMIRRKWFSSR